MIVLWNENRREKKKEIVATSGGKRELPNVTPMDIVEQRNPTGIVSYLGDT